MVFLVLIFSSFIFLKEKKNCWASFNFSIRNWIANLVPNSNWFSGRVSRVRKFRNENTLQYNRLSLQNWCIIWRPLTARFALSEEIYSILLNWKRSYRQGPNIKLCSRNHVLNYRRLSPRTKKVVQFCAEISNRPNSKGCLRVGRRVEDW